MAHRLRPVGPAFTRTAPVRLVFAGDMAASPEVVFRALADDVPGWSDWFPAVRSIGLIDEGAGRKVRLAGGTRFRETIVAAEPGELYAYRVDEATVPGVRALLEEWRLTPVGTGTRVQWTWAADGNALFRLLMRLSRGALARVFRSAVTALDRRLAGRAANRTSAGLATPETHSPSSSGRGPSRVTEAPGRDQPGQTPVRSSDSIAAAYGAMSSPCSASHTSE